MRMVRSSVFWVVAVLALMLVPAAHAGSCSEQGTYRKGDKVRMLARVKASGRWKTFVYREGYAKDISVDYKKVWSLEVKDQGGWEGYFHIVRPDDGTYVRCNLKGKANKEGWGAVKEIAVRFDSLRCFGLEKDENGDLVRSKTPLPVKVTCSRDFNPDKGRLTVKLSFDKLGSN